MSVSNVYWIHQPEHTDIFSQGYVGVTNNFTSRMTDHKRGGENAHFTNVVKKYGWDNLVKQIIVMAEEDYCLDVENKLRPKKGIGWNIAIGGGKPPARYGNKDKLGISSWNKGISWSDEIKQKMSEARKGIKLLPEIYKQQALNRSGEKNVWYGKKLSDEHKKKMSLAKLGTVGNRKGKKNSPEHTAKIKATKALKPKIWTEEERKQISLRNIGIVHPRASCLNCRFEGGVTGMARWHFDKCRNKGELN